MSVLDEILAAKRDEVTMLHRPAVRDALRRTALDAAPPRDFATALRPAAGTMGVIAEIKRRSPSKGDLAPDLDAAATAAAYAAGGASALSVLTDRPFFGGSVEDLVTARGACELPVLRKDFIIADIQVYETLAIGADAILLICAAIPEDSHLKDLHELAVDLGLAVLTEVHDADELERARGIGAGIIGINARSLETFEENLDAAAALVAAVPAGAISVAESAIRSDADADTVAAAGFDAMLVGEYLVKSSDPAATVATLAQRRRV